MAADLGYAGEAWADGEARAECGAFALDALYELRALGAGADEADVAFPHVNDLWEFVEGVGSEKAADGRYAGVFWAGPDCAGGVFGVDDHGSELVEFEDFAVSADALLDVEDGAAVADADG